MKKFNFFIIVLLVLGFVNLASADFTDIENYQYKTSIQELERLGVIEGYDDGTYKPDREINRAEFLKIVIESLDEEVDLSAFSNCFPDVKDQWFAKYVCYAKEMGHVQGYLDGFYKPHHNVNYVEALKIVYEANGHSGKEDTIPTRHGWYYKYLEDAQGKGIALQELEPAGLLTRGEMAELMVRFSDKIDTPSDQLCALGMNVKIPIVEADYDSCRVLPWFYFAVDKDNVYRIAGDPRNKTIYDYEIVEGVDPVTFEALSLFYFKDKNNIYFNGDVVGILDSADLDSFEVLNKTNPDHYFYAKDKNNIYYKKEIFEELDAITFEVVDSTLVKDKNNVYILRWDYQKIVEGADPITFDVIERPYYKDKNHIFFISYSEISLVADADPVSFQVLNYDYARDKNFAFSGARKVEDADLETFEVIELEFGLAKDKNNIYHKGYKIIDSDPDSFERLNSSYFKDKNYVYFKSSGSVTEGHIEGADPATFVTLDTFHYAKDENNVYYDGEIIEGADLGTFEYLEFGLAKDKNHTYKDGQINDRR